MSEPRLALLSVADQRGLAPLAAGLARLGYVLVAPLKTRAFLAQAGLDAVPLEQLTGVPAIFGGQVESLHPAVHGGLVARRDNPHDLKTLRDFGVAPIDVVVANFAQQPAEGQETPAVAQANDQVALLRAAALNFRDVWVLFDPLDYEAALSDMGAGTAALPARKALAAKALGQLAARDLALAQALAAPEVAAANASGEGTEALAAPAQAKPPHEPPAGALILALGDEITLEIQDNPHLKAALWRDLSGQWVKPAPYRQLHGPPLTYAAVLDADAAWRAVLSLPEGQFAAAVAKFGQPCGAASMQMSLAAAVLRAFDAEPVAALGASLAVNRAVDLGAARALASKPWQVVLAPEFEDEALDFLKSVGPLRLIAMGPVSTDRHPLLRHVQTSSLGVVVTQAEFLGDTAAAWSSATRTAVQASQRAAMALAWQLVQLCKSTAVVLADEQGSVGIGAGQVNLADAAQIAAGKSRKGYKPVAAAFGAPLQGPEALTPLVRVGVQVVVQPGGTAADGDVLAAAESLGLAMVLAGPATPPP